MFCELTVGKQTYPAYLRDYSALGCKLQLPEQADLATTLQRGADSKNPPKWLLIIPAGLPRPWLSGDVQCARTERVTLQSLVVTRKPLHGYAMLTESAAKPDLEVRVRFLEVSGQA